MGVRVWLSTAPTDMVVGCRLVGTRCVRGERGGCGCAGEGWVCGRGAEGKGGWWIIMGPLYTRTITNHRTHTAMWLWFDGDCL